MNPDHEAQAHVEGRRRPAPGAENFSATMRKTMEWAKQQGRDYLRDNLPIAANAQPAGFVYLASPYSLLPDKDAAAAIVARAAAHLMRKGEVVYSPIVHGHAIAEHGLPLDWGFWKAQCRPFVDAASRLVVLEMDGWGESTGVQWEIGEFRRAGKPVEFMGLDELVRAGAGERRAA